MVSFSIDDLKLKLLENAIWPILIGFYVMFTILKPNVFLSISNLEFIILTAAMGGTLSLGAAVTIIGGAVDISTGQLAGLAATIGVVAWSSIGWITPLMGVAIILLAGVILGLLNGVLVGKIGLNSVIATVATLITFKWAKLLIKSHGMWELPSAFTFFGGGMIGGIRMACIIFLLSAVILAYILKNKKLGTRIRAVGGNEEAAAMMGINPRNTRVITFMITGLMGSLMGLLLIGYTGGLPTTIANNTIFMGLAGVFIAGVPLSGGEGSILNVLGGALFIGMIGSSFVLFNLTPLMRQFLRGVVLLAAVLFSRMRGYLLNKIRSH